MGERIYVLGYPSSVELGTNIKVTDGIVSSLNTKDLYQISSPVQPGNSGSPLLDMKGRVVGVVNAGIPSLDNVGFAINATDIQAFLRRLGASVATTGGFDKYPFEQLVNMTKGSVYYIKVDY
jgi:S1-C subfamily serine protease